LNESLTPTLQGSELDPAAGARSTACLKATATTIKTHLLMKLFVDIGQLIFSEYQ
jgi:hypothetical protein